MSEGRHRKKLPWSDWQLRTKKGSRNFPVLVDDKHVIRKMSFFFYLLSGRDLIETKRDVYTLSCSRDYGDTRSANSNASDELLTWVAVMEIAFVWFIALFCVCVCVLAVRDKETFVDALSTAKKTATLFERDGIFSPVYPEKLRTMCLEGNTKFAVWLVFARGLQFVWQK